MKLYNFTRLIEKYSVVFDLVSLGTGHYDSGKWVEGAEVVTSRTGAIVPLAENKIYQSGGTLSSKDRNLFMHTIIDKPLKETKVRYKGNEYSIEAETDFDDYCDAYIYTLRWVSAFDTV